MAISNYCLAQIMVFFRTYPDRWWSPHEVMVYAGRHGDPLHLSEEIIIFHLHHLAFAQITRDGTRERYIYPRAL